MGDQKIQINLIKSEHLYTGYLVRLKKESIIFLTDTVLGVSVYLVRILTLLEQFINPSIVL